jgi:hypothetical protein
VSAQEHTVAVLQKTLTSTNVCVHKSVGSFYNLSGSFRICFSTGHREPERRPPFWRFHDSSSGLTLSLAGCGLSLIIFFSPDNFRNRVLELNASDERGISIVREKIKNFARQTPRAQAVSSDGKEYPCPPYKIIILDEADSMTQDAQGALRRIMETYARITRFCLVCNYVTRCVSTRPKLSLLTIWQDHRASCVALFQIPFHTPRPHFLDVPSGLHRRCRAHQGRHGCHRHLDIYLVGGFASRYHVSSVSIPAFIFHQPPDSYNSDGYPRDSRRRPGSRSP